MLQNRQASSGLCSAHPWRCKQQTAGETHNVHPNSEKNGEFAPSKFKFQYDIFASVGSTRMPIVIKPHSSTIILLIIKTVNILKQKVYVLLQHQTWL